MHPIENILQTTMSEIKKMVDVDTIVGSAVVAADGTTIIPVSKVSFGFVSGGGEYGKNCENPPIICGAGSGVSIQPVAFLTVNESGVKVLSACSKNPIEKVLEQAPNIAAEIKKIFDKCGCGDKQ